MDTWISSKTALEIITKVVGDTSRAQRYLDRHAAAGQLEARADLLLKEPDFGPIGMEPPIEAKSLHSLFKRAQTNSPIMIAPRFWQGRKISLYERRLWKWKKGIFSSVEGPRPVMLKPKNVVGLWSPVPNRLVAYGVHFQRDQILTYAKKCRSEGEPVLGPAKNEAPKRVTRWDWTTINAELAQLQADGKFEQLFGRHLYGMQAKIERWICVRLSELHDGGEPSISSVRRYANEHMRSRC